MINLIIESIIVIGFKAHDDYIIVEEDIGIIEDMQEQSYIGFIYNLCIDDFITNVIDEGEINNSISIMKRMYPNEDIKLYHIPIMKMDHVDE